MGGLCGIVRFDGQPVAATEVTAMCEAVAFRGPDGIGTWVDGPAGLGELSLLIYPADAGPGPHVAAEGDLVVAADARLDNRRELSSRLGPERDAAVGELVTAAYRRWGTAFAGHLLGDFAIAIWDRRQRRVVLLRDPMALRAMYYRYEPRRRLLFSTEVAQLEAAGGIKPGIDEESVLRFLTGEPDSLHRSFHAGVEQLAPGWVLVVDEAGLRKWPFWRPDPDRRLVLRDEGEYAEALREILLASVEARCSAEAPVGLMLSGGVDSGSVAAAAGHLRGQGRVPAVRAYTFQSQDHPQMDERSISSVLTDHFGMAAVPVPIDRRPPLSGWPDLAPHGDDPFQGEFTEIIDSVLDAAAQDGCRLVLSADRGDMVNGGMRIDYELMLRRLRLHTIARGLVDQVRYTDERWQEILRRDLLAPTATRARHRIARLVGRSIGDGGGVATAPVDQLQAEQMPLVRKRPAPGDSNAGDSELRRRLGRYRAMRLEYLLATNVTRNIIWTERLHARHRLGFADPWSDLRLVEFALAVPQAVLNKPGGTRKDLTRRAIAPLAPQGYQPVKTSAMSMFRAGVCGAGSDTALELLSDPLAETAGWIDAAEARRQHAQFCRGETPAYSVWSAICLEMWLRRHSSQALQPLQLPSS